MPYHRPACVLIEHCADHVDFQLLNSQTRVKHLSKAINCSGTYLQSSMAIIINYDRPGDKLGEFELAAAFIPPCDQTAKMKLSQGNDEKCVFVSDVTSAALSISDSNKPSIEKTGVLIRRNNP